MHRLWENEQCSWDELSCYLKAVSWKLSAEGILNLRYIKPLGVHELNDENQMMRNMNQMMKV